MKNSLNSPNNPHYKLIAFLGGLSLFLSTIEYIIPKPLPFMRLGLSNIPILVSLNLLPVPYIFLLAFLKVLGQGIVNGTLSSYVFIFKNISLVGVSLIGSLTSNIVQIILSVLFIFGEQAKLIAPFFLILGTISGFSIGLFTEYYTNKSSWYKSLEKT